MLITVVTDGSELASYAVMKMLTSASKNWNAEVLVVLINPDKDEKEEKYKKNVNKRAKELDLGISFQTIFEDDLSVLAKKICDKSSSKNSIGIFLPENLSALSKELKSVCKDIPVEEVTSDLFPSVWDLMTKKVATINVNDTLNFAANFMIGKKIGSLIVMDKGKVAGILTEHDFVKSYAEGDGDRKKVKAAMSKPVITLDRTGTIFEACELMKKNEIKKLVIMDGNQIQGIITTTDLAKLPLSISEGLNYLVTKLKELNF